MAILDALWLFADTTATTNTLAGTTASAEIALGTNRPFAINATQDMTIRFGPAGNVTAAASTDFRIPANTCVVLMTGKANPSFKLFNLTATTLSYYVQPLSEF